MNTIENVLLEKAIIKESRVNEMMKIIFTPEGFYDFYLELLESIKIPKEAFEYCERVSRMVIGLCYYDSFEDFEKRFLLKRNTVLSKNRKTLLAQKTFLLLHFKEIGFTTWESFSPLVLHYYPIIGALRLKAFYNGTSLDKEVIRLVDCVRQIIA